MPRFGVTWSIKFWNYTYSSYSGIFYDFFNIIRFINVSSCIISSIKAKKNLRFLTKFKIVISGIRIRSQVGKLLTFKHKRIIHHSSVIFFILSESGLVMGRLTEITENRTETGPFCINRNRTETD